MVYVDLESSLRSKSLIFTIGIVTDSTPKYGSKVRRLESKYIFGNVNNTRFIQPTLNVTLFIAKLVSPVRLPPVKFDLDVFLTLILIPNLNRLLTMVFSGAVGDTPSNSLLPVDTTNET